MATGLIPRETLVATIEAVADTYVGSLMARAASTGPLRRHGFNGQRLTAEQVELVITSVADSLRVLAGDKAAARAVAEVRKRLGLT